MVDHQVPFQISPHLRSCIEKAFIQRLNEKGSSWVFNDNLFTKGGFPTRPVNRGFRSNAFYYCHHLEPNDASLLTQFLDWKVEVPVVSIIGFLILIYVLLC